MKKGDIFYDGLVVYSKPIDEVTFEDIKNYSQMNKWNKSFLPIPCRQGMDYIYMFNSGDGISTQESLDEWRDYVKERMIQMFGECSGNLFVYDWGSESVYRQNRNKYCREHNLPEEHDFRMDFDNIHFQQRYESFLKDINDFYKDKKSGDYIGD